MANKKPKRLLSSRAYRAARALVTDTIKNPVLLLSLIARARYKAERNKSGKISGIFDSITAVFRLLKAYASGEYRSISLESLVLIVASIIYFVMPLDVLPDFIFTLGLADDASLLAWTFQSVADDIDRFLDWEKQQAERPSERESEEVTPPQTLAETPPQ